MSWHCTSTRRRDIIYSHLECEAELAIDKSRQIKGKKKPKTKILGFNIRAWQFPTFAWQTATLSSALSGFTSEFGMGSGGSRSLWSPSKLVCWWLDQLQTTGLGFSACGLLCHVLLPWKSVTPVVCRLGCFFSLYFFVTLCCPVTFLCFFCCWRLNWHFACLLFKPHL